MRRKLLALLLAAAMAISLLAACGSRQQSAARVLLNLLEGKYQNVSVEMDPDLEADLRQVLSENENDDEAAIRAALEKVLGSTITFTRLGKGQQGDTAFDLVFYAGSDPDKAAQAAYTQWNPVFSRLPADGKYAAGLALVQTENGCWLLVKATVEKAGTADKDKPVTLKSLSVTGLTTTGYEVGDKFDPAVITVSAVYSDGHSEPLLSTDYTITINGSAPGTDYVFKKAGSYTLKITYKGQELTQTIEVSNNSNGYYQSADGSYVVTGSDGLQNLFSEPSIDATKADITLEPLESGQSYTVTKQLTDTFSGKLTSDGGQAKIKLSGGASLFGTIASGAEVSYLDITVTEGISVSKTDGSDSDAGVVAGQNYGKITGCDVTINNGKSITADPSSGSGAANAGGIVGQNKSGGKISDCTVTGGTIQSGNLSVSSDHVFAGGIAGSNDGTIESNCKVEDTSVSATTNSADYRACAGGLVGYNTSTVDGTYSGSGKIAATGQNITAAGGLVGFNTSTVTGTYNGSGTVQAYGSYTSAGGLVGYNMSTVDGTYSGSGTVQATIDPNGSSEAWAGGLVGYNADTVSGTYSGSGTVQAENTAFGSAYAGGLVGYNIRDIDSVTANWIPKNGTQNLQKTIRAKAGDDTAAVPYIDSSNVQQGIQKNGRAYAGTKCGSENSGDPSSHITTGG